MKIDGKKIKQARENAGLSVADLARAADFTENNIRAIENGIVKTMNMNIAKAVAKALSVNFKDLADC